MMLPLLPVEVISYSASWLTFLAFGVGLYECWRFLPLRVFFSILLTMYSLVYAIDIGHGKNPLVLIRPPHAPELVYFWAPVCRQMIARLTILVAIWALLYTYKTYIPPDDNGTILDDG